MSARRWLARFLPDDPEPNPLAQGHWSPCCMARLDKADRPCPMCGAKP